MSEVFTLFLLLPLSIAGQEKERLFACDVSGHYTGNAINPFFRLKIDGPAARSWTYTYSDDRYGKAKDASDSRKGTYEIDGNLAVFTEKLAKPMPNGATETRFGLNFGYPRGELTFNGFFPNERQEMVYRRKWFQNQKGIWEPSEELHLTLDCALPEGNPKSWEVTWKGKRTLWKESGKVKSEEPIGVTLKYQQYQAGYYYVEKPPLAFWIPTDLILRGESGKIDSIAVTNGCIGDLRGFHPRYGDEARQP